MSTGSPLAPADQSDYDGTVAALGAALGQDLLASEWAEGRAMSLEQAVTFALRETPPDQ